MPRILGLSGGLGRPSRTRLLVEAVLNEAAAQGLGDTECLDLADAGLAELGAASSRENAPPSLERVWSAIERCDALVVGSPVYKGSYAGLLKHLLDLLDKDALVGRPVLLVATGRIPEFANMPDAQMRPLFGFFRSWTLPTALYAHDGDFTGAPAQLTDRFLARIPPAVADLARILRSSP